MIGNFPAVLNFSRLFLTLKRNLTAGSPGSVVASPTGYMVTPFGFPLLNWGTFYKFL